MTAGPLEGVRVVELTTAWAGPMAGRVLGFLGAEVIHVEAPTRVNTWRANKDAPKPVNYPGFEPGERPFDRVFLFNSQNVNKRSLILDLKKPAGRNVLDRLLAVTDVLTCNFRPGTLQRLQFDYESLRARCPGIIVAEMPAYGLDGPESGYAALGPTMEMAAGMSAMIRYRDGKPAVTGPSYLDPIGGFNAAAAILTALVYRQATGQGQHIEVPQVEAAMQFIGPELLAAAESGSEPEPDGNHVVDMAPHNAFPARGVDQWVAIAAEDERQWQSLCLAMGRPALGTDPRFATLSARLANQGELDALIAEWTAGQDKHELAGRLQDLGVAAAPVNSPRDLAQSAYLRHRGFFTELEHIHAGRHPHPGLPIHLGRTPGSQRAAAPAFGADNDYVLRDLLGLPEAEIEAIKASGAVATVPMKGA